MDVMWSRSSPTLCCMVSGVIDTIGWLFFVGGQCANFQDTRGLFEGWQSHQMETILYLVETIACKLPSLLALGGVDLGFKVWTQGAKKVLNGGRRFSCI